MTLDSIIRRVGPRAPWPVLKRLVADALGDLHVGLCLHRVAAQPRPGDLQPELSIAPDTLDAFVETLRASRPRAVAPWISLTFDDGYADAAEYIGARAARWPEVEFIFFVCPEKTERQVGFRWDGAEQGLGPLSALHEGLDVESENARADLATLAARPEYRLATVAQCRSLVEAHPNVALGNHTNTHFKQTLLSSHQASLEYDRSDAAFRRLFGAPRHFAFPFGSPEREFNRTHVDALRARGDFLIWSTERRPFHPRERRPGAVLPRFPVRGNWSAKELVLWVAARAGVFRTRGTAFDYTPEVKAAAGA